MLNLIAAVIIFGFMMYSFYQAWASYPWIWLPCGLIQLYCLLLQVPFILNYFGVIRLV